LDDGWIRSSRRKRDLNNFMVPYTKWCGKGWSAKRYSEIGGFSKTGICKAIKEEGDCLILRQFDEGLFVNFDVMKIFLMKLYLF
jgi:Phospholipase A2